MSQELEQDDLTALALLDDLAHVAGREDTVPVEPVSTDAATSVVRRLYLEGLALLAYDLLPAAPRPATRAALLAHLVGDETQEVSPLLLQSASVVSPAGASPARREAARSAKAESPKPEAPKPDPPEPPSVASPEAPPGGGPRGAQAKPAARSRRWLSVLTTLFGLAALGLSAWVAMLQSEVDYREAKLRDLEARAAQGEQAKRDLESAREELATLDRQHLFATAASAELYALRPPLGSGQPTARGLLVLAPDRRHWQLEVRGLRPEPEPQDYQLWFIVDGLPLSGGVFDAKTGKSSWLADDRFPAGATAITITLERKGGTSSPTSPSLLSGESSVRI